MSFKDRFSGHASDYSRYRPTYPRALFVYLSELAPTKRRAWDCGTGNGQAALGLAEFFGEIIATDASAQQIESATRHQRVTYAVAPDVRSGLADHSIDLVTIAQALHWFDHPAFFAEAQRVLTANGIIAAWCYDLLRVSPKLDPLIDHFYWTTVGPYWDSERKLLESGYRTIDFPFAELSPPAFVMEADWSLGELLGYLRTWSAVKKFQAARGFDPVSELAEAVAPEWGEPEQKRTVRWPLQMRVGRHD